MSADEPEVTTVTSKGQITIPSQFREEFDMDAGTKLVVVPTEYGLVLKKLDLPSVEEFRERVDERTSDVELTAQEVNDLVHAARGDDE